MATRKFRAYLFKVVFRQMLSNEQIEDPVLIDQAILQSAAHAYVRAESEQRFDLFSYPIGDATDRFMISRLSYKDGMLFGVIGRGDKRIRGFIRETNPQTMETMDIKPSDPNNVFQSYTHFVLSAASRKISIMQYGSISRSIPDIILTILKNAIGGAPYLFEYMQLMDSDIVNRLQEMSDNIRITGWIEGFARSVAQEKESFRELESYLGVPFEARVQFKATPRRKLSAAQVRAIVNLSAADGYSSVSVQDINEENEVIDVIKRIVALSKEISLPSDSLDDDQAIWQAMAAAI
jgi:hypothetical protein